MSRIKNIFATSLSLARANFKLRNEGTHLGMLWFLLEPLMMFATLMAVFAHRTGEDIPHYPLYLLVGVLMFHFFSKTTSEAITSVTRQSDLIKSICIDPWVFVCATFLMVFYIHCVEFLFLGICFIIFGGSLINLLFYPLVLFFFSIFILGISLILAVIGVYARDFTYVWRSICVVLWFAMPIAYLPRLKEVWVHVNPIYYYISIARTLVIDQKIPSLFLIGIAVAFSVLFFALGASFFERHRYKFAERL